MFIRRVLALLLGVVFTLLLLVLLLLQHVDNTVLNPKYVEDALVGADLYNFLYDEVLPTAFEESLKQTDETLPDDLQGMRIDPPHDAVVLVSLVRGVLPPEDLQSRVENALDQLLPYMTGKTESFTLEPRLDELVQAVPEKLGSALADLDFGNRVVDTVLASSLADSLGDFRAGGIEVSISKERARRIADSVAPGAWINSQIASAADEVSGWLTGQTDGFEIRIQYADRVAAATEEVKSLLAESRVEDFLFDNVIHPEVSAAVGRLTVLSNGVTISDQEVTDALEAVAPRSWIREQVNGVVDSLGRYITGEDERLRYSADLRARRAAAIKVLGNLAADKAAQIIDARASCASARAELEAARQASRGVIPECLSDRIDRASLKAIIGAALRVEVARRIGASIPESVTYTDADLEKVLGAQAVENLQQVRRFVREGFTYTDRDLRKDLEGGGSSDVTAEDIDQVREVLSPGFAYTEADLMKDIARDENASRAFADGRRWVRAVLGGIWIAYVVLGLLLLAIGYLGGRSCPGRLAWMAWTLAAGALVIWLAANIGYNVFAAPAIDEELARAVQQAEPGFERISAEAAHKGQLILDDWVERFARTPRTLFVAALIVWGVALLWLRYDRRDRSAPWQGGPPQPRLTGEQEAEEKRLRELFTP